MTDFLWNSLSIFGGKNGGFFFLKKNYKMLTWLNNDDDNCKEGVYFDCDCDEDNNSSKLPVLLY